MTDDARPGAAIIEAVGVTATHDGEAALVVTLRYPNGALSRVQIGNEHLIRVMKHANVVGPTQLVGKLWHVLNIWDEHSPYAEAVP